MTNSTPYRHRRDYPRPLTDAEREQALRCIIEASDMLLRRGVSGEMITVEMGTGCKVHIKTWTRGLR